MPLLAENKTFGQSDRLNAKRVWNIIDPVFSCVAVSYFADDYTLPACSHTLSGSTKEQCFADVNLEKNYLDVCKIFTAVLLQAY